MTYDTRVNSNVTTKCQLFYRTLRNVALGYPYDCLTTSAALVLGHTLQIYCPRPFDIVYLARFAHSELQNSKTSATHVDDVE